MLKVVVEVLGWFFSCQKDSKSYHKMTIDRELVTLSVYIVSPVISVQILYIYIGETGRPLKQWFSEHYRDAANKDWTKPCGKHFSLPGHS